MHNLIHQTKSGIPRNIPQTKHPFLSNSNKVRIILRFIRLSGLQEVQEPEIVVERQQTLSVIRQFLERQFTVPATRQSTAASASNVAGSARASRALLPAASTLAKQSLVSASGSNGDDISARQADITRTDFEYGPLTVRIETCKLLFTISLLDSGALRLIASVWYAYVVTVWVLVHLLQLLACCNYCHIVALHG